MGDHSLPFSVRTDSAPEASLSHVEVEELWGEKIGAKVVMILLPDGRQLGRIGPASWVVYEDIP